MIEITIFLIAALSDFVYAKWVRRVNELKLHCMFWGFLWAVINYFIIHTIATERTLSIGVCYALGIAFGSGFVVLQEREKN